MPKWVMPTHGFCEKCKRKYPIYSLRAVNFQGRSSVWICDDCANSDDFMDYLRKRDSEVLEKGAAP